MAVPSDFCVVTSDKGTVYQFSLQSTDDRSRFKAVASRFELMKYSGDVNQIKLATNFLLASPNLFSFDGHYIKTKSFNKIFAIIVRDEVMHGGVDIETRVLSEARNYFSRLNKHVIDCEELGENLYVYLKYS